MSLLDDWGPDVKAPIDVKKLSAADLSNIAFLFGGVGDGMYTHSRGLI